MTDKIYICQSDGTIHVYELPESEAGWGKPTHTRVDVDKHGNLTVSRNFVLTGSDEVIGVNQTWDGIYVGQGSGGDEEKEVTHE